MLICLEVLMRITCFLRIAKIGKKQNTLIKAKSITKSTIHHLLSSI